MAEKGKKKEIEQKKEEDQGLTIHGVRMKQEASELDDYVDLLGRKMSVEKKTGKLEARYRVTQDKDAAAKAGIKMVKTSSGYWRPERSVRCSSCQERVTVPQGATQFECPYCGMRYRISWPAPDQPRVRGAVWDALPPPGPWPKGWPGELDENGNPIKRGAKKE